MNSGVTASLLIACIAATPCAGGSLSSAGMTNAEKAKNTPATSPQPSAAASVQRRRRSRSSSAGPSARAHTPVAAVRRA